MLYRLIVRLDNYIHDNITTREWWLCNLERRMYYAAWDRIEFFNGEWAD